MTTSTGSWWLWTGCAAVGVYTYYSLRPKPRGAADDTDFAGFLADPSSLAAPTARAAPPRDETGFDAFLRVLPTAPAADPTGFDSFLRVKPAVAGGAAPPGAAGQQAKQEEAPLDRAGVAVLFGTEYGFSKEIAEKLCAELKAGGAFW
jgi:sulfite reductase (NADPH) flavoprotein alpha-component